MDLYYEISGCRSITTSVIDIKDAIELIADGKLGYFEKYDDDDYLDDEPDYIAMEKNPKIKDFYEIFYRNGLKVIIGLYDGFEITDILKDKNFRKKVLLLRELEIDGIDYNQYDLKVCDYFETY